MQRDDHEWIRRKAAQSIDPAQVEAALHSVAKQWPTDGPTLQRAIENSALGETNLLHLLAVSDVSATTLQRDPSILLWLNRREISMTGRDPAEMAADLHRIAGDSMPAHNFRALRLWKAREMVRIALREVADAARLEQTTAELSQIAELCIRTVYEHWNRELRARLGSPRAEFAILALGKLGGRELNYSSDVDLIFLYDEEGELSPRLSYHEFFNRLGKKILETFAAPTSEGLFLRVDLRLRPEGSAGPLARSLDSMEHYYGGFGETWERLALIKARGIVGSPETAYEFLRQHQPFIYPKSPTPDLLSEIANIKRRIERDVVGQEELDRNVKLGRGGIREIEFVVQTLQFIHGARHAFLQEPSTLKALRALAELELIPRGEILQLDQAYRFLRKTEHRLQIEAEQQTHTVPANGSVLLRLAHSLGFEDSAAFREKLSDEMNAVRAIFNRIIAEAATSESTDDAHTFFASPALAKKNINAALQGARQTHVSPRTRQVFGKLRPLLLGRLAHSPDPDAALNQFVRFADAYGLRSHLFELLVTNPKLLDLLIGTFDVSRFGGDLLVRRPQFLEDVTRDERLGRAIEIQEHLDRLKVVTKTGDALEGVRAYRQRQFLRILLRDVLGWSDLPTQLCEHSDLAEACLLFVNELFGGKELTLVAMGKFGGREISYGADLDVLFVGEDGTPAQKMSAALAQPSGEGHLSRIDTRLRPEGEKGVLVPTLKAYATYYNGRAQPWELQALTRARTITGPAREEFIALAQEAWAKAGENPELFAAADKMHERIRQERGSGADANDFKTGRGGLIEGEFLVQTLQMRHRIWAPNWSEAVEELASAGVLNREEAAGITDSYDFLRRCESALRRFENTSASSLPAEPEQQELMAKRFGAASMKEFFASYEGARVKIHEVYEHRIKAEIRG